MSDGFNSLNVFKLDCFSSLKQCMKQCKYKTDLIDKTEIILTKLINDNNAYRTCNAILITTF